VTLYPATGGVGATSFEGEFKPALNRLGLEALVSALPGRGGPCQIPTAVHFHEGLPGSLHVQHNPPLRVDSRSSEDKGGCRSPGDVMPLQRSISLFPFSVSRPGKYGWRQVPRS